jgi:hypothetical protein
MNQLARPRGSRRLLALGGTTLLLATMLSARPGVAVAAPPAGITVTDGGARFEVLSPTLIRLEYAGDGAFQDANTFNAINRAFPTAAFTTDVSADGYREIHTSALTLQYRQNSGPFTTANTSVAVAGTGVTGAPAFPSYCAFATACEAENALIGGYAATAYDHTGHTGTGFIAGLTSPGSGLTQDVSAVPAAGTYRLSVRYANSTGGDGQSTTRTLSTAINGAAGPTLSLPTTASWNAWGTVSVNVSLRAGVNTISVTRGAADSGNVNLDSIAATPTSTSTYPVAASGLANTAYGAGPTDTLGGWSRSLDNPATIPVPEHPGILDRDGWYLLDDTRTALLSATHVVTDRPSHGTAPYQDGYLFGYGQNYKQGLADLNALTGGTNLLPEAAYGVWYSRYFPYSTADYENTLLPQLRSTFTPIDWLVVDTDWKSPTQWNGWNWNPALFPDPQSFMTWTKQQGLDVALNIHPTIDSRDPRFATANAQAGGLTLEGGTTYDFDWSRPAQLAAYLNLHQSFEQQGVREWWLDYCQSCGASIASDQHVAPDNLINQAYSDDSAAKGLRGYSFARLGGSEEGGDDSSYPLGPWSERRTTMQFTGDTPATWQMMAYEARFTADEAAAGISNVSHDIGSFHGNHLADDMYARWVQLGTFQPIDRLHSDHGDRLPASYGAAAAASAERFLRLREALVPYTYTLARQANVTGVPIVRPLYLNYPAQSAAYTSPGEYLYGDDLLIAPITTASDASGNGSTTLWIPPGTWTDYFTGHSYTGPSTTTITDPLSQMPVLLRAGGIMTTRTDYVDHATQSPPTQLTVNVAAGASGAFTLYQDAGEGTGYTAGQSTSTPISWSDDTRTLLLGATAGSYPGAATARSYTLRLSNAVAPSAVAVDGVQVPETAWAYNVNSRTVTVTTTALGVGSAHTIALTGAATGNPSAGEVIGDGGLCLDIRGGLATDGTPAQLYTCNHTAAQTFGYVGGQTVQTLGKCLDVAGGATANHALVDLSTCNGSAAQVWRQQANGELVNPASGRCLDVPSGNTAPGAVQLQLYDCNAGATQVWRLPPVPVAGPGGLCVDVANADPASGTAVQLYGCNQSDAQRFTVPGDGTARVFGKCLDVVNGASANGSAVALWDCNGTGAQAWQSQADGTLRNPQSGRCLDDPNNNERAGDLLQIYDCNTTTAQQFRLGG